MGWNGLAGSGHNVSLPCVEWSLGDAMGCDAAGDTPQPHWVTLVWVGKERECTWGPVPLPWCGETQFQGVSRAVHACAEDSMRLLDPIVHWPAKLCEVDAAWHIALAGLVPHGWWLGGLLRLEQSWPVPCCWVLVW